MRENKAEAMEAVQSLKDYIHKEVEGYSELTERNVWIDFDTFLEAIDCDIDNLFNKIDDL